METEMNTDERRALKLLRDQGIQIEETEFRKWCATRTLFPDKARTSSEIAELYKLSQSFQLSRKDCTSSVAHFLSNPLQ
jgi:hypothetical protein